MKELAKLNPDIVSVLATRVDDKQLNEFDKVDYEDSILEATRLIAKRYNIINRVKLFKVDKFTTPIELSFSGGFTYEYVVKINGHLYTKILPERNLADDKYEYWFERVGNKWRFSFSKQEISDNVVEIYYKTDPVLEDYTTEKTTPVLPSQYRKELIDFSLIDIAKKGIIKFSREEIKRQKYETLYQLYNRDEISVDSKLLPSDAGFEIKPWTMY